MMAITEFQTDKGGFISLQNENSLYEIIKVPETTGVRFFTSIDGGSYIPSHWHRAVEIIYLLEGKLTVTIESVVRQLSCGDCILINANVMHSTKCTSPNTAIVLQIPLDFMETYIPEMPQLIFMWDDPCPDPIKHTKLDMLKQTLTQMQIADEIRPEGFLLRFNSLLFELLFQLYHSFSVKVFQTDFNRKNRDLLRLNPVLQYTAKNYNRPISIEEIAKVAIQQSGYFCRFFKKCMGITFLEYQNELRLSYIYQDLLTTDDPIHQILERHGFTNYKLFRRMFFSHFGDTPSHVRKRRQHCL